MKCNIPQNQKHEPRNREAEAIIRQKCFESILAPLGCVPKNNNASEKEEKSQNE